MVIDTSALFAIEMGEPEAARFDELIRTAGTRMLSVASALELATALTHRRKLDSRAVVDELIDEYDLTLTDVDVRQMRLASEATVRFGKGRHPAQLNFGDCFAYGLSKATGEPLLFKGSDFSKTDIVSAS